MNLQNNSKEMARTVETFLEEEVLELVHDNDKLDQWNELVFKLGLEGQRSLVKQDKSPIPFMHIKSSLMNVFNTLCPEKRAVEDFDVTPIPVEILDLIALSKKEGYFQKIQILYDDRSPDPICIGLTGYWYQTSYGSQRNTKLDGLKFNSKQDALDAGATGDVYFSEGERYLIGKWGDVKHSFEKLKEMATKRYIAEQTIRYERDLTEAKRNLEDLKSNAFNLFN